MDGKNYMPVEKISVTIPVSREMAEDMGLIPMSEPRRYPWRVRFAVWRWKQQRRFMEWLHDRLFPDHDY
jgi:hypothetical protein